MAPVLLGMGNPLLDISAKVDQELLSKYGVRFACASRANVTFERLATARLHRQTAPLNHHSHARIRAAQERRPDSGRGEALAAVRGAPCEHARGSSVLPALLHIAAACQPLRGQLKCSMHTQQ